MSKHITVVGSLGRSILTVKASHWVNAPDGQLEVYSGDKKVAEFSRSSWESVAFTPKGQAN